MKRGLLILLSLLTFLSGEVATPQSAQNDTTLAQLTGPDERARRLAAIQLAQTPPPLDGNTISALLEAMNGSDPEVRYYAAVALAASAYASSTSAKALHERVPNLLFALQDGDPRVREYAAKAIGYVVPSVPASAISGLTSLLKDSEERVRSSAAAALSRAESLTRLSSLELAVRYQADISLPQVAGNILMALGASQDPTPEVIGVLIEGLMHKDIFVKESAIRSLGRLGAKAKDAVSALRMISRDQTQPSEVRSNAAEAIRRIGDAAER